MASYMEPFPLFDATLAAPAQFFKGFLSPGDCCLFSNFINYVSHEVKSFPHSHSVSGT